jgi:hypothetical protein
MWWHSLLRRDPLPWLLEPDNPAVRQQALLYLLDRPSGDPEVAEARAAAMSAEPIRSILANQASGGYWEKPGPGYATKYRGTVWQVMFLDELGADPSHPQVRAGAEYVLAHSQTVHGGFGASGVEGAASPPPSAAIHCLNGNLLRALIGFGYLDDPRVQRAVDWQARSITGEGFSSYYRSGTSGPDFACAANEGLTCAWGGVKALLALARISPSRRAPHVHRALDRAADFLLGRDPVVADYPTPSYSPKPSTSWWKLGFPHGYVTEVLQNLEALVAAGRGADPRLRPALDWLLTQQDADGRWLNRYSYHGKLWIDFEQQGQPSKWVTLRACKVLKAVGQSGHALSERAGRRV